MIGYSTRVIIPLKKFTSKNGKTILRSIGIAFADFKTEEEAEKVIKEFNGKELKGRVVSVVKAKPYEPKKKEKEPQSEPQPQREASVDNKEKTKPKEVKEKIERKKGPPSDGVPSKTTIFVNNLDYQVTREDLLSVFAEYEPVWAYVPKKRVPAFVLKKLREQNRPVNGRGFGFVRFGSEEVQKKVIEEFNGKTVSNREIIVSVAVDSQVEETKEETEKKETKEEINAEKK